MKYALTYWTLFKNYIDRFTLVSLNPFVLMMEKFLSFIYLIIFHSGFLIYINKSRDKRKGRQFTEFNFIFNLKNYKINNLIIIIMINQIKV